MEEWGRDAARCGCLLRGIEPRTDANECDDLCPIERRGKRGEGGKRGRGKKEKPNLNSMVPRV